MSDERTFEAGGIALHLNQAPPVYAPGGPVAFTPGLPEGTDNRALDEAESAAARRGAVLMIVQCRVEEKTHEALLRERGYTFASSWYTGALSPGNPVVPDPAIRVATVRDVPVLLEIGERKREQYETFSPVFWKKAPTPREEFAPHVTGQVESADNIALVYEKNGVMRGYLIAQCRNKADGYVDDYAVTVPATDWPEAGSALLTEATCRAAARDVTAFTIVAGHADAPKRAAIEQNGFTLTKNWLVKPLPG